jgi:hypothetical protein
MGHAASVSHLGLAPRPSPETPPEDTVVRDPGPWLALCGPISLLVVLAVCAYLSFISF